MQIDPISSTPSAGASSQAASSGDAASAFGLSFEALLRIILTQLTYQDPLKPMDNFEFVSQLAQFSQVQIGQTGNDRLQLLVSAQGSMQATTLLGRTVDIGSGTSTISGKVVSVTFDSGAANVTLQTADGRTLSGIALGEIKQVR